MDDTITCSDCGQPFIFSEGEQKYFAERDFTPPKRCKDCRAYRKFEKQTRAVFRASEQMGGMTRDALAVVKSG